tara:strand:+ start:1217 stop:1621 length:405 start_codon:yes stop_codon:yes gene_type:complete
MSSFTIDGNIGDVFIRISNDGQVQLIFGEDDESIFREVEWSQHELYKTAVMFALMLDSHIRNSKALDNLIVHSPTGSIPAELLNSDLGLPIELVGIDDYEVQDLTKEEPVEDNTTVSDKLDNVIQFKRKDDEDK